MVYFEELRKFSTFGCCTEEIKNKTELNFIKIVLILLERTSMCTRTQTSNMSEHVLKEKKKKK